MQVERALQMLGGVAEHRQLARHTTRAKVRVALARGRIVRDGRGRYALPGADEARRAANRLTGVLWLDSAAQLHGWKLKHQPVCPAVVVPRKRKVSAERREGVRLSYVDLGPGDVDAGGFTTGCIRTVMDCASRLPFDEALTIADSALRSRAVTKAGLLEAAQRMPARYRARCLRVAREADARADNPFESVLRAIALDVPGLLLVPQVEVPGLGRPDLVDVRLRLVVEAESFAFHGQRRMLKRDCERYNAFVTGGWLVVRFSWEHVMFEAAYVEQVLRAMVGLRAAQPFGPALGGEDERVPA